MSSQVHENEIRKDSTGQVFRIQLLSDESTEDINDADSFDLTIKKPDGSVVDRDSGEVTIFDSKNVEYTLVATDTDIVGTYRAHVIFQKTTPAATIKFPQFIYHVDALFTGPGEGGPSDNIV